jgi:hypothetical protein
VGVLVKFVSDREELEDRPPPPPPLLRKSSRPKLKRSWSELEDARLRVAKSNEGTDVGDGAGAGVSAQLMIGYATIQVGLHGSLRDSIKVL